MLVIIIDRLNILKIRQIFCQNKYNYRQLCQILPMKNFIDKYNKFFFIKLPVENLLIKFKFLIIYFKFF